MTSLEVTFKLTADDGAAFNTTVNIAVPPFSSSEIAVSDTVYDGTSSSVIDNVLSVGVATAPKLKLLIVAVKLSVPSVTWSLSTGTVIVTSDAPSAILKLLTAV